MMTTTTTIEGAIASVDAIVIKASEMSRKAMFRAIAILTRAAMRRETATSRIIGASC
ncbi:MAG: hypothetical protein AAFX78_09195 [Cyanobacteria bacterium J06638_20]